MTVKEDDANAVGERVRQLRHLLDVTQEQIADRAGVRRSDIARVENGHNKAGSYDMREKLARAFGLSLEDFVSMIEGKLSPQTASKRASYRKAG